MQTPSVRQQGKRGHRITKLTITVWIRGIDYIRFRELKQTPVCGAVYRIPYIRAGQHGRVVCRRTAVRKCVNSLSCRGFDRG